MHHVAIMKKSWGLIPKILSGEKTIESRWYQTRRAPWNMVTAGDTVFFKNTGEPVTARATVTEVLQFEIQDRKDVWKIMKTYNSQIRIPLPDVQRLGEGPLPRYAILVFLKDAKPVRPFTVDKTGFGSATAWITVPNVRKLKLL